LETGLAHYLWPPRYVGEQPYWEETGPQPLPDASLLSEVVTTIDLPDGVRARVFRDGMIAFFLGSIAPSPYEEGVASDALVVWMEKAQRLANAHLACLVAAIGTGPMLAPSGVVTPWSLMQVEFETGKFRASTDYTGSGARVALHFAREGRGDLGDWRFYRGRSLVTREQIDRSFLLLDALLRRLSRDRVLLRAELLFRATSALIERDDAGALTTARTAIEGLLGDLLSQYLDENENRPAGTDASGNALKFINTDRRKFLEGREMTARNTVELLSLLDVLPFWLYRACTQCASARNTWLHAQNEPSSEAAWKAVGALGQLFELVEEVPIRVIPDDQD
jgi:hypothetical protein